MKMRRKVVKMKSNTKIIILITIGLLFALFPLITISHSFIRGNSYISSDYSDDSNFDKEYLKISEVSGKIHIDNNWTAAKAAGICTGSGTYLDPYVIKNLVINGGGTESCIFIENSQVYFTIKNCRLNNAYGDAGPHGGGIYFINVSNGYIFDNQVNDNTFVGINLAGCQNITDYSREHFKL
jgi:parallel beta-helix repeat protein